MTKQKKKRDWEKIISTLVLLALVISVVFVAIRIAQAPNEMDAAQPDMRLKSDYTLMLVQCLLGIVAMFLPSLLEKKFHIDIPSYMMIPYVIFLYCAIFLGEVRSFYYTVPHWDTMLHTFSGGMLGAIGFSIVSILNRSDKVPLQLSPSFVAIFAFSFAVTLGVFWEIYEYTFDGLMGLNMQKFMLEDGTQLIGRAALSDTMKDLMVDALGAGIVALVGYLSMKKHDKWLENIQLKRVQKENPGQ